MIVSKRLRLNRRSNPKAMIRLKYGIHDTLTFLDFPEYSPKKISTSKVLERLNKEFRRRSKSIGVFPNIQACLRLFTLYAIKYVDSWEELRHKSSIRRRISKQIHLHYRNALYGASLYSLTCHYLICQSSMEEG